MSEIHTLEKSNPYTMSNPFPHPDAPPSIVRAYLARILIQRHEVPAGNAETLVENWKYGVGDELREPKEELFVVNFGDDLGPRLYRAVKKDNESRIVEERQQWRRSTDFRLCVGFMVATIVFSIFSLSALDRVFDHRQRLWVVMVAAALNCASFTTSSIRFNDHENGLQVLTGFFAAILGFLTFTIFTVYVSS